MGFLLEGRGVSFQMLLLRKDYNSILMTTCHSLASDLSKVFFIVCTWPLKIYLLNYLDFSCCKLFWFEIFLLTTTYCAFLRRAKQKT